MGDRSDDKARKILIMRPRSAWMRKYASRDQYMEIARAADYGGKDDPELSRIPRMCKMAIEADRAAAAEEDGYSVSIMKMVHDNTGPKDDFVVGFPASMVIRWVSCLARMLK